MEEASYAKRCSRGRFLSRDLRFQRSGRFGIAHAALEISSHERRTSMIRKTLLAGVAFAALTLGGGAFAASATTTTTTPPTTSNSTTKSTSTTSTTPAAGQYTTEADAKSACGSDLVVCA